MKTPSPKRPKKQRVALPLELKDRDKLKALLNDPVMQQVLGNISAVKPGVFYVGAGTEAHASKDPAMATLLANNRLHEIRGWEMFETALFAQCEDPKAAREASTETYPDEN